MRTWVNNPIKTDQREWKTIPLVPTQEEIVSTQEEIVSTQEEIVSIQEEIVSTQEEALNLKTKNDQNQQLNSQQINNIVFGLNC